MAQEVLDRAQVGARREQMRREGVAEGVGGGMLGQAVQAPEGAEMALGDRGGRDACRGLPGKAAPRVRAADGA